MSYFLLNRVRDVIFLPLTQFLFIFISVLMMYLIPHSEWYFSGEDWGLIAKGSACEGFKDFLNLFLYGKVNNLAPSIVTDNPFILKYINSGDTFFNVYFRPLLLAIHVVLFHFFHVNAYLYFVCIVFLHSLSAALLYLILSDFVKPIISLLAVTFFACHPIMYGWFGRIDTMQNHLNIVFLLILYFLIKNYLQTGHLRSSLSACFIFFLSLLCRETLIVFPFIMLIWMLFIPHIERKQVERFRYIIVNFFVCILIYFSMKACVYPLSLKALANVSPASIDFSISKKLRAVINFCYDFFWLQWLPWTTHNFFADKNLTTVYKFIKLLLIFFSAILFISNVRKNIIVLSVMSAFLMYWAVLFAPRGDIRLFYEALPFMMLALALLLNDSRLMRLKGVFATVFLMFVMLIIGNGYAIVSSMHEMMRIPKKIHQSLVNLKQSGNNFVSQKPLLVMSTHGSFSSCGLIQALALYGINNKMPRYFFANVTVHSSNDYRDIENKVHVERLQNGLRIISHDPANVWFETNRSQGTSYPLKIAVQINKYEVNERIESLTLVFEKHFFDPELTVLLLLFEQERFVYFTCKS